MNNPYTPPQAAVETPVQGRNPLYSCVVAFISAIAAPPVMITLLLLMLVPYAPVSGGTLLMWLTLFVAGLTSWAIVYAAGGIRLLSAAIVGAAIGVLFLALLATVLSLWQRAASAI